MEDDLVTHVTPAGRGGGVPEEIPERLGRYEVRGLLGEGGFGRVYAAFDPQLKRAVAIKVPRLGGADPQRAELFLVEARRLAQLRHPGIVTLHDVGVESGLCFLVSDLLSGVDLGVWLRTPRRWQEIVEVVAGVADALAYAHAHTTIHRDIKPGNIMVTAEGAPVILDFGIALTDAEATGRDRRQVGTPAYMSPEQTQGAAHRIDGRTDIYGLGVVLYEALCGRRPFAAEDPDELYRQIREDEPQPPRQLVPSLPRELERICLQAMAKRIVERHPNASDLAAELRQLLREEPAGASVAAPAPGASPGGRPSSRATGGSLLPSSSVAIPGDVERRHITVLASGFSLAPSSDEGADPEEELALTVELRRLCAEAAHRHQGTLLATSGPGVLVCFGFPQAFEDAAPRAVRSALDVLAASTPLRAASRRQGVDRLALSLAIHSSIAVVGAAAGGDGQLDVVGEARSVAPRLEDSVAPNTVTITGATHRLVSGLFECRPAGARAVKGVAQPVQLFEVLRPVAARSRLEGAMPAELSPLIGRDQEVGLLLDRWEHAQDGRGQVVLLVGEPGIGKSRLVHVLKERVLDGADTGSRSIVEWRCAPHHENSSFHPVIDFFERKLALTPELTPESRLDRLEAHLAPYGMHRPDVVPLFAELLSIPCAERYGPLALSPQRQKDRTLEALVEWSHRNADRRATLLIVEDLHWIDASTLELLGMLAPRIGAGRTLAVLTSRPGLALPWAASAQVTQVALNRLTRRQTAELIGRKAGPAGLSAKLVDQLAARTDGVPLFVEELTRSVMESDLAGAGELSATSLASAIPASLHDLLMARIDRMAGARELLWLAAALGREISHDVLSAASALQGRALERELAGLVQAEILYPRGLPPRCDYQFKHALIQDAVYQSMVTAKRQQLHRTIARVLEERFPATVESQPELVAHHHAEAGAALVAVGYWERAGARAQQRFALVEAIGHYRRGLELLAMLPRSEERDRQELRLQAPLAVALTSAKGWAAPEVEGVHARARELCERLHERAALFHVLWGTWAWRLLRAELDVARTLSDELLALAASWQEPGAAMEAHWAVGCTSLFRGDFERGHEHFTLASQLHDPERSRQHAQHTGQDSGATLGAHWGWLLWHLGYPDRALAQGREAVARARGMAHPFSEAFAIYHHGCVLQHCGMTDETLAMADATLRIGEEQSFAIWKGLGTLCKGAGLAMGGRHEEGAVLIRAGLGGFEATGAGLSGTHYCCRLAEALLAAGRIDDAAQTVATGLAMASASSERFAEAELHRLRGDVALARSDASDAEACYRAAIEVARRQAARSWELRATTSLCRLLGSRDERGLARETLSAILGWFTEGFATRDLVSARELETELGR